MLITVERANVPGPIQSGLSHGLYWRIVSAFNADNHWHSVYLMVLVPTVPLDLVRDPNDPEAGGHVDGIPSPHVWEHGDLYIDLTSPADSGLSPQLSMQWVESYYGEFYSDGSGQMQRAVVHFTWGSVKKYKGPDVVVPVNVFLQRMQPSAEYLCKMLRERIVARLYDAAAAVGEFHVD